MYTTCYSVHTYFVSPSLADAIFNCLLGNGSLDDLRTSVIGNKVVYLGINRHANFWKPDVNGLTPRFFFTCGVNLEKLYKESTSRKLDIKPCVQCFFDHLMTFDRNDRTTELLHHFKNAETVDFVEVATTFYAQQTLNLLGSV